MNVRYEFLTGEVSEIEVDDALGQTIVEIEHAEKLSNRRETRRHESYSDDNDKRDRLVDSDADVEADNCLLVLHYQCLLGSMLQHGAFQVWQE